MARKQAAKKARANRAAKPAKPTRVAVKIQVEPSQATPVFYANYFEVSNSQHDCALTAVRVPAKFSSSRQEEMARTGVMALEPELQITFPPTLLRPLADALTRQAVAYDGFKAEDAKGNSKHGKKRKA